jgi:hypothetical protein
MLNLFFDKQKNIFKLTVKLAVALLLCFVSFFKCVSCEAYWGWGNWAYYGLGSSLLWPLNSLVYPGTGNSYTYGLGWPLYSMAHLGNRYANNMAINSYRNIPYTNYSSVPYTNNYNAYNYPAPVWQQQPSPATSPANASPVFNDPNDIFNYRYPNPVNTYPPNTFTQNNQNPKSTPQTAPDRHYLSQATSAPALSYLASNQSALEGFFQTVNTRYKSNLLRALNQADMKSWAQSIGLIAPGQNLHIDQARKNSISTMVKDNSLTPQKKLDILRLLLQ